MNTNIIQDNLTEIIEDLAQLRLKADLTLLPKYPSYGHKTYPLGRCREIRDEVFNLLVEQIKQPKTRGIEALRTYMQQGHQLKKIWGGLRGCYFQNAMMLGEFYLDVSNDTVNPNKPRVEIKLATESGFSEISSFEQFAAIAEKYWQVSVFKNSVCASLAPIMPILCVDKANKSWLATNDIMIQLALSSQFVAAEQVLAKLPEPTADIKIKWQALLEQTNDSKLNNSHTPEYYCKQYRNNNKSEDGAFRDELVKAFLKINKSI